jgi:hypothetical protein
MCRAAAAHQSVDAEDATRGCPYEASRRGGRGVGWGWNLRCLEAPSLLHHAERGFGGKKCCRIRADLAVDPRIKLLCTGTLCKHSHAFNDSG